MSPLPFRVMPRLDAENSFFWTSGRDGTLRFLRCGACRYFIHPPAPVCPACLSRDVHPEAVSGRGVVYSFTVNHQQWAPDTEEPYVIAVVQLAEQADLRLTTNVVGVDPGDVHIGMAVGVAFEDRDPVFLPVFEPVTSGDQA